jgi:hypothetical protein
MPLAAHRLHDRHGVWRVDVRLGKSTDNLERSGLPIILQSHDAVRNGGGQQRRYSQCQRTDIRRTALAPQTNTIRPRARDPRAVQRVWQARQRLRAPPHFCAFFRVHCCVVHVARGRCDQNYAPIKVIYSLNVYWAGIGLFCMYPPSLFREEGWCAHGTRCPQQVAIVPHTNIRHRLETNNSSPHLPSRGCELSRVVEMCWCRIGPQSLSA